MPQYVVEQRVAEAVAREAGRRILGAVATGFDVSMKAKNDFVTNVDVATETFIKAELLAAFPEDSVFGEERGGEGDSDRRWFIDPIDGTTNFVRGIPVFCVSIALRHGEQWVVGAVYDPNRDELFSGRHGGELKVNGVELEVSDTLELADAILATGFPPQKDSDRENNIEPFSRVVRKTRAVRRLGSAALDLAYVACGRLDGFWEFHLNPWDTGASAFLVQLAGGTVSTHEGQPHTGFEDSIVATNTKIHEELVNKLRQP